jgi:hypothetical protein
MLRSTVTILLAGLVLAGTPATAQQSNSLTASLTVNGTDPGFGPIQALADPCSGLNVRISSGPNANARFSLALGPLFVGSLGIPGVGILDLDVAHPTFAVLLDGIFGGLLGGNAFLNSTAVTDLGGQWQFSGAIGFGSLAGNFGTLQALVTDPTSPAGYTFTAATSVTVISGAVGGVLAPPMNGAVTHTFASGFAFPFYGTTYTQVHVAENAILGFGSLANLLALNTLVGTPPNLPTNSAFVLGLGGVAAPPTIGFFEDLVLAANGGQGTILWSESPTRFNVTWCDAAIASGGVSTVTVTLHGTTSSTPGRIEITVTRAPAATTGNGRVLGISPGGTGAASLSPVLTSTNLSAVSRNIQAGGQNQGFTPAGATAAIFESFNFAWAVDPINPVFDLLGVPLIFSPAVPATGTGPYTLRAQTEAPLSLLSVQPISSPLAGGSPLTVRGTGFRNDGTTSLALGAINVSPLTYVDSETLTGTVPVSPSAQVVNVAVTVGSLPGTATIMNGFSYTPGPLNGTLPLLDEEIATYNFAPSLFGTFNLYGVSFTRVHVHANGHLFFSATTPTATAANFISDPATWNAFAPITVAPFFNDICGDPVSCGVTGASVTTVETTSQVTIRWVGWAHWPNFNPGINFAVTLDKTFNPSSQIIFDYSQSVAPNLLFSQPGGQAGFIVGMKPAGPFATGPVDFQALSGGALGVYGPIQPAMANLFHWIRSPGYTGTVPASQPSNTWIFGTAAAPGPLGNRMVSLLATDPMNTMWTIALL